MPQSSASVISFLAEEGRQRVPVRVIKFQGTPLETVLSTVGLLSAPRAPAKALVTIERRRPRQREISVLLWCVLFSSLLVAIFGWFGVHRSIPWFSGQSYRPTFPVAADRRLLPGTGADPLLPAASASALAPLAGNRIVSPALDLSLPLVLAASLGEKDLLKALSFGVVLYPNGVEPGTQGTVVVTAHNTGEPWKGPFRFAFLHINKLRKGDVIHVDYGPRRFTYAVVAQRTIDPRKNPNISSEASRERLTLSTCWPLWRTDQRLLVEAVLATSGPVPAVASIHSEKRDL